MMGSSIGVTKVAPVKKKGLRKMLLIVTPSTQMSYRVFGASMNNLKLKSREKRQMWLSATVLL